MPKINLLDKNVSELIAAGEVVERPSSAIKELVENSIDAKSTAITVEIKQGGITYIRVADNGCGIRREDTTLAFMRHATSKISVADDLYSIATLGFRGEALAAISSVSRVEMLTKTAEEEVGTRVTMEGGENATVSDAGCPDGTTIIVRDLFFITPARMKFLKKDVAEGNSVVALMSSIALSHPEIAFKVIRDGKLVFSTVGDNNLLSTIYSVCGREFANSLIEVQNDQNGVKVKGYVTKPTASKARRTMQYVFLNGRYVKSGTVCAALEQAYKNSVMVGRYPACVLHLSVPYSAVDINVHPAKTEVRFSDEKRIFDCVYYGVVSSIRAADERPEISMKKPQSMVGERMTAKEFKQTVLPEITANFKDEKEIDKKLSAYQEMLISAAKNQTTVRFSDNKKITPLPDTAFKKVDVKRVDEPSSEVFVPKVAEEKPIEIKEELPKIVEAPKVVEEENPVRFIGEAFKTYIIVEKDSTLWLIDKHAAHERMLFERLKNTVTPNEQLLLVPKTVVLPFDMMTTICENTELLKKSGFDIEGFGDNTVIVRSIPNMLSSEDVESLVLEIAENLATKRSAEIEKYERILETVACRAAVKAGNKSTVIELEDLAKKVLSSKEIMYCPHGRPVAIKLTKKEIEKQFGRIQ